LAPRPPGLILGLAEFVEEKSVTEDIVFPISAREATSLKDAYSLYLKSRLLLKRVNAEGKVRFADVVDGWPDDRQVGDVVRKHFRYHGRFMLAIRGQSPIGLLFGLEADPAGEATFTVWLEADPKYPDMRSRVHALAESAGLLSSGWSLRNDGWQMVECRAHTGDFPTIDSAVAWFMQCFGDLERAGLLLLQREVAGIPSTAQESGSDATPD
jgi:hypothetical protein